MNKKIPPRKESFSPFFDPDCIAAPYSFFIFYHYFVFFLNNFLWKFQYNTVTRRTLSGRWCWWPIPRTRASSPPASSQYRRSDSPQKSGSWHSASGTYRRSDFPQKSGSWHSASGTYRRSDFPQKSGSWHSASGTEKIRLSTEIRILAFSIRYRRSFSPPKYGSWHSASGTVQEIRLSTLTISESWNKARGTEDQSLHQDFDHDMKSLLKWFASPPRFGSPRLTPGKCRIQLPNFISRSESWCWGSAFTRRSRSWHSAPGTDDSLQRRGLSSGC